MSKRITTRWFIGAWVVAVTASIAMILMLRGAPAGEVPVGAIIARLIAVAAGLVMLVMWIAALIKLGQQRELGWFAFVLLMNVLTFGALGIIAMVAYAIAGPEDAGEVVIRPRPTAT